MAIFLIITVGTSFILQTQARSYRYLDVKLQIVELRNLVTANVDCQQSLREVCDRGNNQLISAKQAISFAHSHYIGQESDKTFRWVLRPHCTDDTLFVDARFYNGDKPAKHPITKQDWDWQPVFKNGLCRRQASATASCPPAQKIRWVDFASGEIGCR